MKFKISIFGLGFLLLFSIPLLSQYAPFYVLDGYGGVHAGGSAPAITPGTPYWGWDIAKSIDYVPVAYSSTIYGDGYLVLDGYGGVWQGGKLASLSITKTPYWGFNVARSLVYRVVDPQAYGSSNYDYDYTTSSSWQVISSDYMILPDYGNVLVNVNCNINNGGSALDVVPEIAIGVDSSTTADEDSIRYCTIKQANAIGGWYPAETLSSTKMFSLGPGQHYFYFLYRRADGTGNAQFFRWAMSALYVNKSYDGYSLDRYSSSKSEQEIRFGPNNIPSDYAGARK